MQCKDIPDRPILELLARNPDTHHLRWDISNISDCPRPSIWPAFPKEIPEKLVLAKMEMLIRRGLVDGCWCGCRGDFTITEKGLKSLFGEEK